MNKFLIFVVTIVTLLVVALIGRPLDALYELAWDFRQYNNFDGNIEKIEDSDSKLSVSEIQNIIPFGVEVEYDSTLHYFSNYAKYHLYPIKLKPTIGCNYSSDYFLTNQISFRNQSYPYCKALSSGHFLYSKNSFLNIKKDSIMLSVMSFIFFVVVVFFLGYIFLSLMSLNLRFKILFSFLVGYTIVNTVQFLFFTVFGTHPTRILFMLYFLIILVLGYIIRKDIDCEFKSILNAIRENILNLLNFSKKYRVWCLIVPSFLVLIIYLIQILITPVWSGDAIAFWMLKAKVLAYEGIEFNIIPQNEYPIFWPQFNSMLFDLQGSLNDAPLKWLVSILLVNLSLIVFFISKNASLYTRSFMLFLFYVIYAHATVRSTFAETIFFLFTFFIAALYNYKIEMKTKNFIILSTIAFIGISFSKIEGVYQYIIIVLSFQLFTKFEIRHFLMVVILLIFYFTVQSFWSSFIIEKGWPVANHFAEGLSVSKFKVWLRALFLTGHNAKFSISVGFGFPILILVWKTNIYANKLQSVFITAAFGTVLFSCFSILGWETGRIQRASESATVRTMMHSFPLLIMFMYEAISGINTKTSLIKHSN